MHLTADMVKLLFFLGLASVYGQNFEISPMVGGMFGGSFNLGQQDEPRFKANIADSITFSVAGGFRFDQDGCESCGVIGFRWLRQGTHLTVSPDSSGAASYLTAPFKPAVTFNDFLGDFTHEFPIEDTRLVRPFLTGTLGAVHLSTPASGATRFAFGVGTGIKVFPSPRFGFQVQVDWLAIVLHANVQTVLCTAGCLVAINGGITNQFQVSVGPAFRF